MCGELDITGDGGTTDSDDVELVTGDVTGDGGTIDSDDMQLVTGDVTGDGGTTESNDIGLVAGGVGYDSADTNASEEAACVRSVSKVGTVMSRNSSSLAYPSSTSTPTSEVSDSSMANL